jgi:hypothetical protein
VGRQSRGVMPRGKTHSMKANTAKSITAITDAVESS